MALVQNDIDEHGEAGDWEFASNGQGNWIMLIRCPGCGKTSCLYLRPVHPSEAQHPSWDWDGNKEAPTLQPSVHHNRGDGCGWHGWLRAGKWVSV